MADAPIVSDAEAVALGELEDSLGFLLRVAQVRSFERFYAAFDELKLRPGEYSLLWLVKLNPGVRQGHLGDTLRVKPAQMSKMIRRLEQQGRLRRVIPDGNRRSVLLHLTDAGEAFITAHHAAFFGHDDYHQHDLTQEEEQQLAALLRKYSGIRKSGQGPAA
ncbi:DNA-binding MarR family transcriptional regulator [Sagittula marina]|uniref:DNA-binding MarR family transcriptional regulator n=1 Tax=Sagittula marina TaxID=943940 RepID=A0A7W6DTE0_9RHOB|nr:MarR family transcriptional regulator [Sagittula marina]MBB3987371.1 DNA-binding MarR family transcriptional regulator [Sagittula marina]